MDKPDSYMDRIEGWECRYPGDVGIGVKRKTIYPDISRNSVLSSYSRINFFRMLISPVMSTKTRVTGVSGNPVVASRNKTKSLTGRDEGAPLSPIQRMRGNIHIADPAMVRRIIFDPSLEP
jgi:hypothetical protein